MKRLTGLSTVVSVFVAGAAGAQDPLPPARLSLEQAIEIALARHPRLERLQHEVLAAEAAIREARAPYYPWVSVQGVVKEGLSGATGGLGLWGLPASPFFDKGADAVNVSFDIYDFGRTGNRVEEARFTAASLRSQEEAEKARRIWQAKAAYYRCFQTEALLQVARETLEERTLTARQAQVYFEVQLRSKLDGNLAEVNRSAAEAEVLRAENERRVGFAALNLAMGVEGRSGYELEPVSLEMEAVEPLERLLERALAARPELLAVEQQVRAAGAFLDAAESERLPRLTAAVSAGYARFETIARDRWVAGLGFSVQLPGAP